MQKRLNWPEFYIINDLFVYKGDGWMSNCILVSSAERKTQKLNRLVAHESVFGGLCERKGA